MAVTVEEVEMWQEEAVEIIRLLQNTSITSKQDADSLAKRVQEFRQTMDIQTNKLQDVHALIQSMQNVSN